ncbi:MAG: lipoate-protein ligase B [Rhodovulum sulfidophilum]|uniref:Octanoyltransferase n=1 Tax=Rhodovulum sulfidophilum TaxID=35806 RepID=A0A2W5Q4F0_RHOSU|nr:MAG: lipoate-protein ligase B [Rhodovulum sulfidophilum]
MSTQPRESRSDDLSPAIEWRVSDTPVAYPEALATMETRVEEMIAGQAGELVWLLEHPPLYTAGTSARAEDLLMPDRFPVYQGRRGGEYTYHGPGQRVAYAMLDLNARGRDVRAYVWKLEEWVIRALAEFNVTAERRAGRVGVWVARPDKPPLPDGSPAEDKIAAIGVRVRRWIAFHGIAINVEPDLEHFAGIVPCGIRGYGVTSLVDLGLPVTMADLDVALARWFETVFGAADRRG